MKNLSIQTVKEYNANQSSLCMKFQNNNGSLTKRGFVVSFNDEHKFCKTKAIANAITEKDFIREESPIWYNSGSAMSNIEYINQ